MYLTLVHGRGNVVQLLVLQECFLGAVTLATLTGVLSILVVSIFMLSTVFTKEKYLFAHFASKFSFFSLVLVKPTHVTVEILPKQKFLKSNQNKIKLHHTSLVIIFYLLTDGTGELGNDHFVVVIVSGKVLFKICLMIVDLGCFMTMADETVASVFKQWTVMLFLILATVKDILAVLKSKGYDTPWIEKKELLAYQTPSGRLFRMLGYLMVDISLEQRFKSVQAVVF